MADSMQQIHLGAQASTSALQHHFGAQTRGWSMAPREDIRRSIRNGIVAIVIAIPFGIVAALLFGRTTYWFWFGLVAIVALGVGLALLFRGFGWSRRADEIHLFTHGLVVVRRGGAIVPMRYASTQVEEKRESSSREQAKRGQVSVRYVLNDGDLRYRMPNTAWTVRAVEVIQAAMATDRLAAIAQWLDNGQTVGFGPVSLTAQGFLDRRGQLIPYGQIVKVGLSQGSWYVHATKNATAAESSGITKTSGYFSELTDGRMFLDTLCARAGLKLT